MRFGISRFVGESAIPLLVFLVMGGGVHGAGFTLKPGEDAIGLRDEIRAARKSGRIAAKEAVTVTLLPGDHIFTKTLLLEADDSGTADASVTWRAEKSGAVRILGGVKIPRSAFHGASADVCARLDSAVAGKVLEADVRPLLVREPGPWPDSPEGGRMPGPWLYVGGRPQQLARWPNDDASGCGWVEFANVLEQGGYEADKRAKKSAVLEFPGDRAERWRFDEGVWFMGYFVVMWNCDLQRIASYDKATHGARFAGITKYGVGGDYRKKRFYAVNLLEELDAPREWYYDRKAGKVFWYPGGDEGEIVLALDLAPAIRLDRARHVRIENLDFAYFHGASPILVLDGADQCLVKACTFENISFQAVDMSGRRNRVTGCRMTNCGASVVRIGGGYGGGARKELLPENNLVDNCIISNYGMYQRTWSKAFEVNGCGNAVRECLVSQAPDGAIIYTGNEHLFADNDFGHIVLESCDAGAIYSGYNPSWLGTLIVGNYIHHLAKTEAEEDSRNAIYFDDCDWGDDVIGNVLERCGRSILIGGGKLHGVYNNLVSDGAIGVHVDGRGRDWRMDGHWQFHWTKTGRSFADFRHGEAGINPARAPWCVVYPALRDAMDNRPEYPLMNEVKGNVFQNCRKLAYCDYPAKQVFDPALPGNTVVTNKANRRMTAPQPVRLRDAVVNRLASPDGRTCATVLLDESGHLAWTLKSSGQRLLDRSPLGITVGNFDYGRRIVPGKAEVAKTVSLLPFTNATCQVEGRDGAAVRNKRIGFPEFAAKSAQETRIPIRSLFTGEVVAMLEFRVWNGGAAYRWTVPGEGVRMVYGENDAFLPGEDGLKSMRIVEWGRDLKFVNGYPEACYYPRGKGCGVSFPEFAHGWTHTGPIVTPWRGVLFVR